jgi:hypothetical protein
MSAKGWWSHFNRLCGPVQQNPAQLVTQLGLAERPCAGKTGGATHFPPAARRRYIEQSIWPGYNCAN